MEKYSSNGNVIPINALEASEYTKMLLSEYDNIIKNHKDTKIDINPYSDKIIMPLENGKFVEIPQNIQDSAILEWQNEQNELKDSRFESNESNDSNDFEENEFDKSYDTTTNNNSFIMYFLLLIIVVVFLFLIYQNKSK